jgi:hypothetical protein
MVGTVDGTGLGGPVVDLPQLDAELRRLRDLRSRWDELLGHLAMLLRQLGLWRDMQFIDFRHYCEERLGMSERAVEQRAALERRLYELPTLRDAMREGRVSYEKARIVAASATEQSLDHWIERASRLPCIALAREAEDRQAEARSAEALAEAQAAEAWAAAAQVAEAGQAEVLAAAAQAAAEVAQAKAEAQEVEALAAADRASEAEAAQAQPQAVAQVCAGGAFSFRVPSQVAMLLDDAFRTARAVAGHFLSASDALELVAEHFIDTWKPLLAERNTVRKRVRDRDRGWCKVPGCSRAGAQSHHVRFRSHGGATKEVNLVSLCAAHHLHGIHAGYLRVTGLAPHRLTWTFREGGGPELGHRGA